MNIKNSLLDNQAVFGRNTYHDIHATTSFLSDTYSALTKTRRWNLFYTRTERVSGHVWRTSLYLSLIHISQNLRQPSSIIHLEGTLSLPYPRHPSRLLDVYKRQVKYSESYSLLPFFLNYFRIRVPLVPLMADAKVITTSDTPAFNASKEFSNFGIMPP